MSGEDVSDWLPDPLPIERACTAMGRTTKRCVVFGNNTTVTEACMECGAKSVLLLGRMPRYELQGADTVVDKLTDLSMENLKRLFTEETSDVAEPQREKVEIFPTKFAVPDGRGAELGARGAGRRRRREGAAGLVQAAKKKAGRVSEGDTQLCTRVTTLCTRTHETVPPPMTTSVNRGVAKSGRRRVYHQC